MAVSEAQKKANDEAQAPELVVQRQGASVGVASAIDPTAPGEQLWASRTTHDLAGGANTVVLDEVAADQRRTEIVAARVDQAVVGTKVEEGE